MTGVCGGGGCVPRGQEGGPIEDGVAKARDGRGRDPEENCITGDY